MINELVDSTSSLEYGVLIAIVIVAIMMFAIKAINERKQFNALSYIIALAVVALLTYQMGRLVGACQLSNSTSDLSKLVGVVSPTLSGYISSTTSNEIGWFIFRRVMWSVLFVGIGAASIIFTMNTYKRHSGRPNGAKIGRRYTSTSNKRRR